MALIQLRYFDEIYAKDPAKIIKNFIWLYH